MPLRTPQSGNRDDREEKPVFLLGVGRCGSTLLQLRLCRTGDLWIWGEHSGILRTIFEWADQVRASEDLRAFTYCNSDINLEKFVLEPFRGNPTHLAWLNGFDESDLVEIEKMIVRRLMNRRLPSGKTRWGFKEIRYGIDDDVPRRLLTLFPLAKIVHTLRHPYRTVESAIFEWSFDELKHAVDQRDDESVLRLYETFLSRWLRSAEYFWNLQQENPERVFTSRLESQRAEDQHLCTFLEIDTDAYRGTEGAKVVNSGNAIRLPENARYLAALREVGRALATGTGRLAGLFGYDLHQIEGPPNS